MSDPIGPTPAGAGSRTHDPTPERTSPMKQTVTVPATGPDPKARGAAWHHPNFRGYRRYDLADGTAYYEAWAFAAFTGQEPDPETTMPDHVLVLKDAPYDSPEYRASVLIYRELHAANTHWQVARWKHAAAAALLDSYPTWQAYAQAKDAADAAYAALHTTPDGQWRAALLRLAEARIEVLAAATRLGRVNANLDNLSEGLPERVTEELPSLYDVAKHHDLDVTGWDFFDLRPSVALEEMFREQDKRIAEVARLAGDRADR